MRAGPTKKIRGATTSAKYQVLLRALAGAFLLLALRVEPAAGVDLQAGDRIIRIDGQELCGRALQAVMQPVDSHVFEVQRTIKKAAAELDQTTGRRGPSESKSQKT